MLSVFPTLFSYQLVVPFAFRIVIGIIFVAFGYLNITRRVGEKSATLERFGVNPGKFWLLILAIIEILGGIMFIIGLYTQVTALVLSILLAIGAKVKGKHENVFSLSLGFILLLLLITSSLLFLGPGFYSIDLPL